LLYRFIEKKLVSLFPPLRRKEDNVGEDLTIVYVNHELLGIFEASS